LIRVDRRLQLRLGDALLHPTPGARFFVMRSGTL
jgi:hypothetical protein